MAYEQRYKNGKCSLTCGNKEMLKPMARMTQAPVTMESIIDMNVDQMPHLIEDTKNGHQDVWKVLPAHLTWEKV